MERISLENIEENVTEFNPKDVFNNLIVDISLILKLL